MLNDQIELTIISTTNSVSQSSSSLPEGCTQEIEMSGLILWAIRNGQEGFYGASDLGGTKG